MHIGEWSNRGRVRLCQQSRVGSGDSGRVNVLPGRIGSDRVGSKKSNPWTTLIHSRTWHNGKPISNHAGYH